MNQPVEHQLTQLQRGVGEVAPSHALVQAAPEVGDMFYTIAAFEAAQRMATALAKSDLLPKHYHEKPANCLVLLSIANRFRHMGVDPFMVAQQLVPVNGKYGWQGQFVIAVINQSGRFSIPLQFLFSGKEDDYGCVAKTLDRKGKEVLGTKITWKMVKGEGWSTKAGSKWQTMPEQMFMYRAAAFFGRVHCPDLLMGFSTVDEVEDMKDVTPQKGDDLTATIITEGLSQTQAEPKPGFTSPKAPAEPQPQMFDDRPKRKITDPNFGKLRSDSLVDDVDKH